jgi:hypothetical protein
LNSQNARRLNDLSTSAAAIAALLFRSRCDSGRTARTTSLAPGKLNGFGNTASRFLEIQRDIAADIGTATLTPSTTTATTASEQVSKQAAGKHVAKGFEDVFDFVELAAAPFNTRMTVLIVASPLFGVVQYLVCLCGFFEAHRRVCVVGVGVGVIL